MSKQDKCPQCGTRDPKNHFDGCLYMYESAVAVDSAEPFEELLLFGEERHMTDKELAKYGMNDFPRRMRAESEIEAARAFVTYIGVLTFSVGILFGALLAAFIF